MQASSHILKRLKERGHRFTKTRGLLLELLLKSPEPLSALDLQKAFSRSGTTVAKTTVYREFAFLMKEKVIRELDFGDSIKRYEIMPDNHHHHIMCVNCRKIEEVVLEKDLDSEEKMIAKNKQFKILNHSLEFFGLCAKCQ
ncbi:transcriptional repressor [Candidatus Peregrinibacteria bacterium]|nr:transcriptional repressor [Candidatus Peregrinibacteria bacterium]